MTSTQLHRYIAVFEKQGDVLIDKVSLSPEEFEAIRSILGYDKAHPMYDCYPLEADSLRKASNLLHGKLKTGNYDYFLETESV